MSTETILVEPTYLNYTPSTGRDSQRPLDSLLQRLSGIPRVSTWLKAPSCLFVCFTFDRWVTYLVCLPFSRFQSDWLYLTNEFQTPRWHQALQDLSFSLFSYQKVKMRAVTAGSSLLAVEISSLPRSLDTSHRGNVAYHSSLIRAIATPWRIIHPHFRQKSSWGEKRGTHEMDCDCFQI